MANHGVGSKFVSVNLNKSYGQPPHPPHQSSYGSNRTRTGSHGGGGGMVVLSRSRNMQKIGPKLSVPPPLNLPSLRKEHERFDSSGLGSGQSGGSGSGNGSRPTSSGMGWTKPGTVALQEKDGGGDHHLFGRSGSEAQAVDSVDQGLHSVDGVTRGSGVYMPPSARSGTLVPPISAASRAFPSVEKAVVLRGEDFPSLQAALPTTSGPAQKPKDGQNQKQKHVLSEELSNEQRESDHLSLLVDMRPQVQPSHHNDGNRLNANREGHGLGSSCKTELTRKQDDYFPGPLPLVRLNPRSDWADDERDTGHGFTERARDHGFSKTEAYWDRDFDMPRSGVLPHKPAHNVFDRWGQRDNEAGKVYSSEVPKLDPYGRDVRTPSRDGYVRTPSRDGYEGNSWRTSSPLPKGGFSSQEVGNDRGGFGVRPSSMNRETSKENNKYAPSPLLENSRDDFSVVSANRDSALGRRDMGYGQGGKQHWNHNMESFSSRGAERNMRDRHGNEHNNRYRGDAFQNSSISKSSFSLGGKSLHMNDPILNFGREKRSFVKNEKPYLEDPFLKDYGSTGFDGRDPFSGGLVGLVKRKKEVAKPTDFHDPVRESFEAELERVQKMQEMERQKIIEEQERAMELARREEEERARLAREQEEQQRKLEEEARQAAWRAEQDRVEAVRRAEEQKIAREEEKRRILVEEERRKQAAKQKLMELEAKIARRQAEMSKEDNFSAAIADEKMLVGMKGTKADLGDWDDGERLVERITTSASSDSSSLGRSYNVGSRPISSREISSPILDRGKSINSWRRDAVENGNSSAFLPQDQENGHQSPRPDASAGGRGYSRKEFFGGGGFMSSRSYYKGGMTDHQVDDYTHAKGHRWNLSGDGDHYGRDVEIDSEFHDNIGEKFGDVGWGQGPSRGHLHPPYLERMYQNSDSDELYSFGRSRYSMRQPRVLPPPSLASMHKMSYRGENERPGPSTFPDSEMQYDARNEPTMQTGYDNSAHQEKHEQSEIIDIQREKAETEEQKLERNATPRCDSQSSLSVSSPPTSPTHLSHDDLDESGDSSMLPSTTEGKEIPLSGNEQVVLSTKGGKENMMTASSSISTADDEEWSIDNNEQLQEQEEYDEDEEGYHEEDEVHEADEHINLTKELEDMHLGEKGSPHMVDNLVLGLDEGVEVRMPSDEFERSSGNEESTFMLPKVSLGTVEEQGAFGGIHEGQTPQLTDGSPQVSIDGSGRRGEDAGKAIQDLVIQPVNGPHTSVASDVLNSVDASISSSQTSLHPAPSSVNVAMHSSSGKAVTSTVSAAPGQAELPVKLQFGLFSGPSLIPSPVPAIQIGSIQMPLHLHPQVGPSLTHIHPSQPPLFQFGQLRYTSPISQGILPLAPQSMSFVQPNVPAHFTANQNPGGSIPVQAIQNTKIDIVSLPMDSQLGLVPRNLDLPQDNASKEVKSLPLRVSADGNVMTSHAQADMSHIVENSSRYELGLQVTDQGHHETVKKNYISLSNARESEGLPQNGSTSSQSFSRERDLSGSKAQGPISAGKGRKYMFTVKNSGPRSSFPVPESSRADSGGFQRKPRRIQRTEFRVRENPDRRQSSGMVSSNHSGLDDKSNISGRGAGISSRTGSKKGAVLNKPLKHTFESEGSGPIISREVDPVGRAEKGIGKEALTKNQSSSRAGEGNLKRSNICAGEDVDAPLQSGIVRVFEQPGIEAPSDEDDFIEVRSKRQMLNDRREQREKEIKAKSRVAKMPRKPRSTSQSAIVSTNSNKISAPLGGEATNNIHSDFAVAEGRAKNEVSTGFSSNIISQPLAPIGTPTVNTDSQADIRSQPIKSLQTSSLPVISSGGKNIGPSLIFDTKNTVLDNVPTSLGSWGNGRLNKQVMALTQTQLDEAMKPPRFDTHVTSIGDHTTSVSEPSMPSSSILTKDKTFSSAVSPINSLLAGEKIQFGAVTSPTILPPSSHAISHGIGAPGSCRSDIQISHDLSSAENDCGLFFKKEKHTDESCIHLEDCEAEAEAAASAIAVAAISNDEIVGNGLGACSVSVTDSKGFGVPDLDGTAGGGVAGDQQLSSQSRAEESLSVALPADLSVDTPPISLWPALPSPQNTSSQMLSHFPGGQPSPFPVFEMNPMMGSPIFAFGPHDESVGTQSQTQKSSASGSGPLGAWPQCHSGVDSFYGPPAGFTGPFISPPGGIPGVQGPPHMVVYNHFAPVGQFGQVGLSFMGTTYIPSGKQPDWKHNPTSSAMGIGDGDMNNLNMVSAMRNPPNMPAPIQHLAPGSPLLPMASPLAMFDVSPFQSSPDMPMQARWSHVPASPLHSVPLSLPLQQQADAALPSQFNQVPTIDHSLTASRFPESRTSTPSDGAHSFPVATDATVTQLPDELGLVDPSTSTCGGASTPSIATKSTIADTVKTDAVKNGSSSQTASSGLKSQSSQQKNLSGQQYNHSTGYNYQRGVVSQKNGSGGEWSHRRMGFQGRNQTMGVDKNFPSSKMKQIYVAKQPTSGTSTGV